jgi:hypothetical protein
MVVLRVAFQDVALVSDLNTTASVTLMKFNDTALTTSTLETPKDCQKRKGALVHHPQYNGSQARPFQIYPYSLPCLNGTMDYRYRYSPNNIEGMFYTKLSKCSSSTLAGIAVQIARNEAKRRRVEKECLVRADHGSYRYVVTRPDKTRSILWTFIREPASRQVSDFFHFHVSRRGVTPHNDALVKQYSLEALSITNYMTGNRFRRDEQHVNTSEAKVEYILNAYDFIGLVERYHESLVLLKLIYNLELRDILYTSAKQSGGYDDGEYRQKCTFIQRSNVSDTVKDWFQHSTEWSDYAQDDILLYRVVDKIIDLTIDAFGRNKVQREVRILEEALDYANEQCAHTAVYPCSGPGTPRPPNETTCVAHDWACAHACIEDLDLSMFKESG